MKQKVCLWAQCPRKQAKKWVMQFPLHPRHPATSLNFLSKNFIYLEKWRKPLSQIVRWPKNPRWKKKERKKFWLSKASGVICVSWSRFTHFCTTWNVLTGRTKPKRRQCWVSSRKSWTNSTTQNIQVDLFFPIHPVQFCSLQSIQFLFVDGQHTVNWCSFHSVAEIEMRWTSIRRQRNRADLEVKQGSKSGGPGGKKKYAKDPTSWYLYGATHFLAGHSNAYLWVLTDWRAKCFWANIHKWLCCMSRKVSFLLLIVCLSSMQTDRMRGSFLFLCAAECPEKSHSSF